MPFAVTAADMIARYDARTLGDLVTDTGTRLVGDELTDSTKLATLLDEATGHVKASLFRANRYTQDELDDLTGESLAFLTGLVCQVAFWMLWRRKPAAQNADPQRKEAKELYEAAMKSLNSGELVLDVEAVKDAGVQEGKTVDAAELDRWNLWSSQPAGRFYPSRRFPQ